ncbi:MAG TPA: TetR family transcriptional regulator [Candidatus Limnocylindrales bacterium]
MTRSGRRPGDSGTRDRILAAARAEFAESGYDAATIRAIARRASVDPALVHHYFGSKQQLFVLAMELPVDPTVALPGIMAGPREELGERIVRFFLAVWEQAAAREIFTGMLRSAVTDPVAAAMFRTTIVERVVGPIVASLGLSDPRLRVTLVGSQLVGLALVRYVIRVEPLASAAPDDLVAIIAPTIQRYLDGPVS